MVSLSNNTQGNVNITTKNGKSVNLTSNNDTDVNANMNGNAQRAKSWAVGEGLIDGEDYSAKYYAEKAKESQEIAERSIQSEDNAHIWAEGTDEEVQALGGEHSSKGWVDYVIENAPTATVEQTAGGATITITDINGTTTADITNGTDGQNGADGQDGISPTATVTKSGSTATISITDKNGTTSTTISDGTDGVDGAAATISVGTVSTGAAGTSASVTNSGTSSAAVFNFTIPKGDKGDTGNTGATGQTGATGNGISSISKTGTSGLVDTYTITYTNTNTDTFTVTNGKDGTNGTNGTDGQDGYSPTASVSQSGSVTTIDITDKNGTTTANIDLSDYATQQWAQQQSGLLYTAMQQWVQNQGYTTNVGTVTSVNNTSPDSSGNVSITIPTVPTNISAFTNDSGYITSSALSPYALSSSLATVATSGSYNDLSNKPTIPDAQVQADWNVTNTTSKAYIKNKPYIPPGVVIDQTYDGTSTNAQSGVAIEGAGFATETWAQQQANALATSLQTWVGNQGYLTSIPSGYLQNTATATDSLTILGTTQTAGYGTNVGYYTQAGEWSNAFGFNAQATGEWAEAFGGNCTASGDWSIRIGHNGTASGYSSIAIGASTSASGYESIAIGASTSASADYAIQLGEGTNSTARSLQIGFGTNKNYTLLDGTTGLIPDARISSNIARTSAIPTVPTNISSFTNDSGYITSSALSGYLQATNGNTAYTNTGTETSMGYTDTSTYEMYGVIAGKNTTYGTGIILGAQNGGSGYLSTLTTSGLTIMNATNPPNIQTAILTVSNNNLAVNGSEVATQSDLSSLADTDLSNLSATGKTVIDGQWVTSYLEIVSSDTNMTAGWSHDYSVSSYLPSDNYNYEVLVGAVGQSSATSGQTLDVRIGSDIIGKDSSDKALMFLLRITPRSSARVQTNGCVVLPIGTGRQIKIQALTNPGILSSLRVFGYRRIGTNT